MIGTRLLVGALTVVVVAVVLTGVVMLGPPSEQRARRLDQRRVLELQGLGRSIDGYRKMKGRLPGALADISRESGAAGSVPADPITGVAYIYRVVDPDRYEICAIFDRASDRQFAGDLWAHSAGLHCFTRKADAAE
jgi:hypothetical protein